MPHTRVVRISAGKLQEGRGHPSSSLCHHLLPRFRFTVVSRAVAKALSAWAKKAAAKSRLRQGMGTGLCCPAEALPRAG